MTMTDDSRTIVDLQHLVRELRHEVANARHGSVFFQGLWEQMMRKVPPLEAAIGRLERALEPGVLEPSSLALDILQREVLPAMKALTEFEEEKEGN